MQLSNQYNPVNSELSDIFLQLHISERTGRGVPKIIGAYDKEIYRFGEDTIAVILPFDKIQTDAQVNAQVNAQVSGVTPQVDTPVSGLTPKSKGLPPKSMPQSVG